VYDYRVVGSGPTAHKRAVPIGHWSAEARAFVPDGRDGPILVYAFGPVAYHDSPPKSSLLEGELRFAKPLNATAGERMSGG
jgi:hypothetical protein